MVQPPRRYGRGLEESNPRFAFEKARRDRRDFVMHSQLMVGRQHERKKIADSPESAVREDDVTELKSQR